MHKKLFLFISFLLFSSVYAQTGSIKGFIHPSDKSQQGSFVYVLVLNTDYKTTSDLEGVFYLNNLPAGNYQIRLSHAGYRDTVLQNIQIKDGEVLNLRIEYPYCQYDSENKTCPVCSKKDEVIPIMYGFPSKGAIDSEKKGKLLLAGCEITGCDPHWYCKRDKNKF